MRSGLLATGNRARRIRILAGAGLLLMGAGQALAAAPAGPLSPGDEAAVRKILEDYERSIETKDISLFKEIKPNLSPEDERRLRAAFDSIRSQDVKITLQSMRAEGDLVVVLVHRRDDIDNGRLIAAFPQTMVLARTKDRWTIQEINRSAAEISDEARAWPGLIRGLIVRRLGPHGGLPRRDLAHEPLYSGQVLLIVTAEVVDQGP